MVNQIYPPELKLNKANTSDTEAPFLDLHLSISNGFISSKIYDKLDDFGFDIFFLDGDVPRLPLLSVGDTPPFWGQIYLLKIASIYGNFTPIGGGGGG